MKEKILTILEENRGKSVSGGKMADTLGVTRAAVNKAVASLRAQGYQIEAVTGRGYRLAPECDRLSAPGIRRWLKKDRDRTILIYDEVASTNLTAKEVLPECGDGALVLAQRQSMGRGRMGRSFYSPQDMGVYMTIGLHPQGPAEQTVFITVAAAVAVSRAIDTLYGIKTQIKWVNDIYYEGKKVCGILTEGTVEMESGGVAHAVLGIGINTRYPKNGIPEELEQKVGILPQGQGVTKNRLAAEVANQFDLLYERLYELEYLNEYREKSMLIGRWVTALPIGGEPQDAEVLDIDGRARLVVRTEDGNVLTLSGGEVSIIP